MLYKSEQLYGISTEEYFYLTENFEPVDSYSRNKLVKFLVYNKKQRLIDTVKKVMTDELTGREREMAIDYWQKKMPVEDIAEKYDLSRSGFYRAINVIKKKLETSLKYVLFYSDALKPPTKEDFLTQMKRATTETLGEQIEN
jgi:predicted DNA-binding protein YlxM (UPF0122 family)